MNQSSLGNLIIASVSECLSLDWEGDSTQTREQKKTKKKEGSVKKNKHFNEVFNSQNEHFFVQKYLAFRKGLPALRKEPFIVGFSMLRRKIFWEIRENY